VWGELQKQFQSQFSQRMCTGGRMMSALPEKIKFIDTLVIITNSNLNKHGIYNISNQPKLNIKIK
jgi:hypothetical protein